MFDLFVDLVWAPIFERLADRFGKAGAIVGVVSLTIILVAALWYHAVRH